MGPEPVGDAFFDRGDGGEMEAAIDAVQGRGDDHRVRDITLDQGRGGGQVGAVTGGQVIQHADGVVARDQSVAQVGADEAGSSGDQIDAHGRISGERSLDAA